MKLRKYSGQFRLRVPIGLHMELVKDAKIQGVSLNTYIIYRLSMDDELERILLESGATTIGELIKFYKYNFKENPNASNPNCNMLFVYEHSVKC